jgi:hypothetical protein
MFQLVPNFGERGKGGWRWGFLCWCEICVRYIHIFLPDAANDPARNF